MIRETIQFLKENSGKWYTSIEICEQTGFNKQKVSRVLRYCPLHIHSKWIDRRTKKYTYRTDPDED